MFDAQRVQQDFSEAAIRYDTHAQLQQRVRAHAMMLARGQWPAGAQVLDAGSGTGAFVEEAHAWRGIALDLSYAMCRVAQGRGVVAVNADAGYLPFPDGCFDGVFSSLMLQWANEPQRMLQEMARVLKPSASAVLAILTAGTLRELAQAFAGVDAFPHVSRFHTVDDWRDWAHMSGFSVAHAESEQTVEYYADVRALMCNLRLIGANNKQQERRRGIITPRQFARVEQAYGLQYCSGEGLPASWQVLYLIIRRR